MREKWRVVEGFENYAVSSRGRVKRLKNSTCGKAGAILKASGARYLGVTLMRDGKKHSKHVHVLVAVAFHGPRPPGLVPNHQDGRKTNNAASNLEWGTQGYNMKHAYELDLSDARGEKNGQAKLAAAQVISMRESADGKRGQLARLAREFSVSPRTVSAILKGTAWPHLLAENAVPA